MTDKYYESRYIYDKNRSIVWREIVRYLNKFINKDYSVLDLGAGYCDFINNIEAKQKIAVDYSPLLKKYAGPDVQTIESDVTNLSAIKDNSINLCFASNLLEHLTDSELDKTMLEIKRVLKDGGLLILMQPNYRLSYKNYFDDPTHKKVFSDESLKSFLISYGFKIELMRSRFLPFSMKSRPGVIPIHPLLIRAYLNSPFKPFAGQMLFVCKKI